VTRHCCAYKQQDNSDDEDDVGDNGSITADGSSHSKVEVAISEDVERYALSDSAPEPLQRCYRLLVALLQQASAPYFYQPKDPALHISYYEAVARPLALRDVAAALKEAADAVTATAAAATGGATESTTTAAVAAAVTSFVEDVRLVFANAHCVAGGGGGGAGSTGQAGSNDNLIAAADGLTMAAGGDKLSAVFERLVLDWLVDPAAPPLAALDDDVCCRCGVHHRQPAAAADPMAAAAAAATAAAAAALGGAAAAAAEQQREAAVTAAEGLLLMCDRCDLKYHLECLELPAVPDGDWFCAHCVQERSLRDVDPLIGTTLTAAIATATVAAGSAAAAVVTDVHWRHADRCLVYVLSPPADTRTTTAAAEVQLTWEQLTTAFNVPVARPRPFPLGGPVPGYKQCPSPGPSTASTLAGIPPALDPTISARAAALDSMNPEFRALGQAQAALCGEGAGESGRGERHSLLNSSINSSSNSSTHRGVQPRVRGARAWLRILSALAQSAPLVCDSLQKAMAAGLSSAGEVSCVHFEVTIEHCHCMHAV
jgi:PHD-finger